MLNFIYGSSERIFLNASIGCNAGCSYCYLPRLGIRGNGARIAAENLLETLRLLEDLMPLGIGYN